MKKEHRSIVKKLMSERQVRIDSGLNSHEADTELTKAVVKDLILEDGLRLNKDFVHRYGNLLMLTDTYVVKE